METTTANTDFENYILSCIFPDEHGIVCNTDKEKLQFLVNTCISEHASAYEIIRCKTFYNLFKSWIMGAPSTFNIDFMYHDIINIASLLNFIPANPTDKQVESICENWYKMITETFISLCCRNCVVIPSFKK